MGARGEAKGVTTEGLGEPIARRTDSSSPFANLGIAQQTAWGIACDICGKGHDPAVHTPSMAAVSIPGRVGDELGPDYDIYLGPSPEPPVVVLVGERDAYHYTPEPVAFYADGTPYYHTPHPDDHLFSDDAERADDAARKRRRASLVAERGGPLHRIPRVD